MTLKYGAPSQICIYLKKKSNWIEPIALAKALKYLTRLHVILYKIKLTSFDNATLISLTQSLAIKYMRKRSSCIFFLGGGGGGGKILRMKLWILIVTYKSKYLVQVGSNLRLYTTLIIPISGCYNSELHGASTSYSRVQLLLTKVSICYGIIEYSCLLLGNVLHSH